MTQVREPYERASLGAALRVACPRCGCKPITARFGEMVERCPCCGLRFEREEGYWVGALIVNLGFTMLVFLLWFGGWLVATWPDVPWNVVLWAGFPVIGLLPIWFYPRSKTLWLWFDLRAGLDAFGRRDP